MTSLESRLAHLAHQSVHLQRRFFRALSDDPPATVDEEWAVAHLSTGERDLWHQMQNQDKRHCLEVARRFVTFAPDAPRFAIAAALMHDVGKVQSRLGAFARVTATLVGPRTKRFRLYHDHERIGADLLRAAGSAPETVALVEETSDQHILAAALRRADDI